MDRDKIIEEMLTAKANKNNTIDLNAYGNGLADMYDRLVKLFARQHVSKQSSSLSNEQLERADMWYCLHKNHVNKLYHLADNSFPPTLTEDKNNPALWKAGHWKWYLDNYR